MTDQHIAAIHQYWSHVSPDQNDHKRTGALLIPRLNKWYTTIHNGYLRISGLVEFHSDYPDGATITTSSIRNHLFLADRLLVATKHTLYELGVPLRHKGVEEEAQPQAATQIESFGTIPDPWGNASNGDCTTLRHIQ